MKTLIRFSQLGILGLSVLGSGVHADPPSAYKSQVQPAAALVASRQAAGGFKADPAGNTGKLKPAALPPGVAANGLRSEAAMDEAARRKKQEEAKNSRAGTWTVPEASTCKPDEVATANGCVVSNGKPIINEVAPPNISNESNEDETATERAKNVMDAFTQSLQQKYPNMSPSDPNIFYRPEFQDTGRFSVGPANLEQMEGPFCPTVDLDPSRFLNHSCQDGDKDRVTCMVCNLYYEAGNDPNSQVAVGNTVMTRLFNKGFPVSSNRPTTCNVVYDKTRNKSGRYTAQYSWTVENKSHTMTSMETLRTVVKNARTALCSKPGTYSNYWAPEAMVPKYSNPPWGAACQGKVTHGKQVFCRFPAQAAVNRSVQEVADAEGMQINGLGTVNILNADTAN